MGGMYVKIQYLQGMGNKVLGVAADSANGAAPTGAFQQNAQGVQQPQAVPSQVTTVNVKVLDTDPVKGNPNAKVTVVEFADLS